MTATSTFSTRDSVSIEKASLNDLDAVAALHLEHLRHDDNLMVLLGPDFVTSTYRWFLTSPNAFVLVARLNKEVAGFTSVSERPYAGSILRAGWMYALQRLSLRPWFLFRVDVLSRIFALARQPTATVVPDETAHVAYTVVRPDFRGQGVGTSLKAASINECMRRGKLAMVTGVLRTNMASRRMNERAGFREIEGLGSKRYCYYLLRLE